MRIFTFGKTSLIEQSVSVKAQTQPLRLFHLFTLRPADVILTPRPWVIFAEALLLFRPHNRPRILQLADGIAFPLNARKSINRRYGGLQHRIFADGFIARQNLLDFDQISTEAHLIRSTTKMDIALQPQTIRTEAAILVAGNDPFFDQPMAEVLRDFQNTAKTLRRIGVQQILLSSANPRLETALRARLPWLKSIGKIRDYTGDISQTMLIGSPSTVLLEHQQTGGLSLLLSRYTDPILNRYLSSEQVLDGKLETQTPGTITLMALAVTDCQSAPIPLTDLLAELEPRAPLNLAKHQFLRALRPRLILRELQFLLGLGG